jgi:hypothetical protein
MRILFSVRNPWYVRHYDTVLQRLCARGHSVCLVADGLGKRQVWPESVHALARETNGLTLHWTPVVADEPWFELGTRIRQALYFLRFLQPAYDDMPMLLARAEEKAPPFIVRLSRAPMVRRARGLAVLTRVLRFLERRVPPSETLMPFIQELRPDVVVLTPLIVLRTVQLDLLRLAARAGIPTAFGVASWDHLSSKGLLLDQPDTVLVWNDTQAREAVDLHGVPPGHVHTTGAQLFDDWFSREPRRSREEFCRDAGLDPGRPYILYVGSALFEGSPSEAAFAALWVRALRSSPFESLRMAGLLLRPHPRRASEWSEHAPADANAVIFPTPEAIDAGRTSRDDYFDSVRFASVVVGINTSAMIEAAILERPVATVLLPEFRPNQEGTIHFRYLIDPVSGFVRTSPTLAEHAAQLAATLENPAPDAERSRRFVRSFVRPRGVDVDGVGRVVDELERTVAAAPPRRRGPARAWRLVLRPFATLSARAARQRRDERHARKRAQRMAS